MKFKPNESVLRVALIIFCVIFGVLSISLISLGVVYMDDLWWPRRYVGLDFLALPTLVIILGSISFLMSIIGCWYAKTYNRKFFIGFICVLVVILCLELTISIISFDNMTGSKEKHIRKIMEEEAANMTNGFKEFKDHYKCCGLNGTESECSTNITTLSSTTEATIIIFVTPGCYSTAIDVIWKIATRIGWFTLALALFQALKIMVVTLIYVLIK